MTMILQDLSPQTFSKAIESKPKAKEPSVSGKSSKAFEDELSRYPMEKKVGGHLKDVPALTDQVVAQPGKDVNQKDLFKSQMLLDQQFSQGSEAIPNGDAELSQANDGTLSAMHLLMPSQLAILTLSVIAPMSVIDGIVSSPQGLKGISTATTSAESMVAHKERAPAGSAQAANNTGTLPAAIKTPPAIAAAAIAAEIPHTIKQVQGELVVGRGQSANARADLREHSDPVQEETKSTSKSIQDAKGVRMGRTKRASSVAGMLAEGQERMASPASRSMALPAASPVLAGQNGPQLNQLSMEAEFARSAGSVGQNAQSSYSATVADGDRARGDGNQPSSSLGFFTGRLDAASIQKADSVRVFISQVDSALQTMRHENSSNIRLRVSIERGEIIRIHLNLRGDKLKTTIQTDNENARQLLRSSWTEVSRALAQKGVEADTPDFSDGSGGSSDQADGFDGMAGVEFTRAVSSDRPDDGQVASLGVAEGEALRFFSRIA
jgi:hypothetical protein